MKIHVPEKPQRMETANGHLISEDDVRPEAAKEKRKRSTGPEACEDLRAIEPCWEGQWRILKYL
jgi:hypothetical protein